MDQPSSGRNSASWLALALFLLAVTLLVIWPLEIASSIFDEKRLVVVTLLAIFVGLFAIVKPLRISWLSQIATLPPPQLRILMMILLLGGLSSLNAVLPGAALTELALWIVMFTAITAMAALHTRLGSYFDLAITGMLAFILFVYLLLVSGYIMQALLGVRELDFRVLYANFSHLRFFNQFQSWTLPLAVLPLLYAEQRGWKILKWIFFIAAANWWVLLFLSGGRGTLMAVAIASVVTAFLFKGRMALWLKWHGLAALGGLLIYLVLTQLTSAVVTLSRTSLSGREDLWRLALSMIADHPLLGVGPMHYACGDLVLAGHPHNAPLQIAAEWGLPAALLLSGLLLWLFYRAVVQTRRSPSVPGAGDIAPVLLTSLLAATLHAQLCGIIVMPISQITMVMITGWTWGVLVPARTKVSTGRLPHVAWLIITAASIALLMSVVTPVWRDTINGTTANIDREREYWPRFWIDSAICAEGSRWRTRQE